MNNPLSWKNPELQLLLFLLYHIKKNLICMPYILYYLIYLYVDSVI